MDSSCKNYKISSIGDRVEENKLFNMPRIKIVYVKIRFFKNKNIFFDKKNPNWYAKLKQISSKIDEKGKMPDRSSNFWNVA